MMQGRGTLPDWHIYALQSMCRAVGTVAIMVYGRRHERRHVVCDVVFRSRPLGRLQSLLQESLQRVTGGTRGTETLKQVGSGEGGELDDSGHSFGDLGLEDGGQVRPLSCYLL